MATYSSSITLLLKNLPTEKKKNEPMLLASGYLAIAFYADHAATWLNDALPYWVVYG